MFDHVLREIKRLEQVKTAVSLPLDDEGHLDRECPNDECQFLFKIHVDDWKNICRDEEVFCPLCRHAAPAKSWFTTEQAEKINNTVQSVFGGAIGRGMKVDADAWNLRQPSNSFIKITMSVKSSTPPIVLPISAADPMRQKATCTQCECRYSYVGRRVTASLTAGVAPTRNAIKYQAAPAWLGGKARYMSHRPSSSYPGRRDLIRAGILAGMSAVLPWQGARADLRQVARDRTRITVRSRATAL
jgi:hypothetical protein